MHDIKYIFIDVDGTMTDGGIYYDEHGNEMKKFSTRDAAGFFAAKLTNIKTIVVTGRECSATTRRIQELGATELYQNVKDKTSFVHDYISNNGLLVDEIAFIGDDINDLQSMKLCGYKGCPADACMEICSIADYISVRDGGKGAVRDVIEHILREAGKWDEIVSRMYKSGV